MLKKIVLFVMLSFSALFATQDGYIYFYNSVSNKTYKINRSDFVDTVSAYGIHYSQFLGSPFSGLRLESPNLVHSTFVDSSGASLDFSLPYTSVSSAYYSDNDGAGWHTLDFSAYSYAYTELLPFSNDSAVSFDGFDTMPQILQDSIIAPPPPPTPSSGGSGSGGSGSGVSSSGHLMPFTFDLTDFIAIAGVLLLASGIAYMVHRSLSVVHS